jgi:hypothetical protein
LCHWYSNQLKNRLKNKDHGFMVDPPPPI